MNFNVDWASKKRFLLFGFVLLLATLAVNRQVAADEDPLVDDLRSRTSTAYLFEEKSNLLPLSATETTVEYQKFYDGLEILGNRIIVHLDEQGAISFVQDDPTENFVVGHQKPAIESTDAIGVAESVLKDIKALGSESRLVWFRKQNIGILAWQIETELPASNAPCSPTHLMTTVDAATGEVLSQWQQGGNKAEQGVFPYSPIVINDAVGPGGAQAFADPFTSACRTANSNCSGSLIAPNVLLSARHCEDSPGDFITFGANSLSPNFTTTVQAVSLPAGPGSLLDGGDVVIMSLNSNVPGNVATPMRLLAETNTLVGDTCRIVGFGAQGVGSTGSGMSNGFRWGCENVIDAYGQPAGGGGPSGANVFSIDFDNGTAGINSLGSATPTVGEGSSAPGDSGGPFMVVRDEEHVIVAVVSGGTSSFVSFGTVSWYTAVSVFRPQIEAAGGVFVGGSNGSDNDNWIDSVGIANNSFPVSITGTNVGASIQTSEQQIQNTGATAWWFIDAPQNGTFTINTFNSTYDTQLHVYLFPNSGQFADLTPVVNNDDSNGTFQSQVSFPAVQGQCYEIRVGGFDGDGGGGGAQASQGEITLNVNFTPDSGGGMIGDVNCDGAVDLLDVGPFVDAVSSSNFNPKADINQDDTVDLLDVGPFVDLLSGG